MGPATLLLDDHEEALVGLHGVGLGCSEKLVVGARLRPLLVRLARLFDL
jgi:hypothetical protein